MQLAKLRSLAAFTTLSLTAINAVSCKNPTNQTSSDSSPSTQTASPEPETSEPQINIHFIYGSEKQPWIAESTNAFNQQQWKTEEGSIIFISQHPMESSACISKVLDDTSQPHLVSPSSSAFIYLGNAESKSKNGNNLVEQTQRLCLSPIVIAMWKPMANALGHGKKSIGWEEISSIAQNPKGWAAHDMPQWGEFRLGHTHPNYSTCGLIALIAEAYAASSKQSQLTSEDIDHPPTGDYIEKLEQSIVHYGKSTGSLCKTMLANGPNYLSAAVLYESMVIESYDQDLELPIVAIYPKEGTLYSDHPIGIVNRDWVTPEHKQACQLYIDYLLDKKQQELAMQHGLRPSDPQITLSDKFTPAYGVDNNQPHTILKIPSAAVINDLRNLWLQKKKKSHIVLAIDTSNSMAERNNMRAAKAGAQQLLKLLEDEDTLSIVAYSESPTWVIKNAKVGPNREHLNRQLNQLTPKGSTSLYDAVFQAFQHLQKDKKSKITAVVVLSNGANTTGSITSPNILLRQLDIDPEHKGTCIFTIAYGQSSTPKELSAISNATKGKHYKATPTNIKNIFEEIATFF